MGRPLPKVYLDHVINVVDPVTMKAIGESSFIKKEFAHRDTTTVKAEHGRSWSGTYIFGKRTYIELFTPSSMKGLKLDDWGAGLVVEGVGEISEVFRCLKKEFPGEVSSGLSKRVIQDREVPWYQGVAFKDSTPDAPGMFVSEHLKSYMDLDRRLATSKKDEISRVRYLSNWFDPSLLLADVVHVTVSINRKRASRLVRALSALGYKTQDRRGRSICKGPGVSFVIIPSGKPEPGVTELKLALTRRVGGTKLVRFGERSTLRLHGKSAFWTFKKKARAS